VNFLELQQRAAFLASRPGYLQALPNPDWGDLVNGAIADFSWDTEYNVEETTFPTVVNQAEYPLATVGDPRGWKFISDVAYGTTSSLYETTEQTERAKDPLWLVRPADTPARYYLVKPSTLRLVAKPSQGGVTLTVRGVREAPPLVLDTDVPAIPGTYHEAIAVRAATLHLEQYASEPQDWSRMNLYRQQYDGQVKDCKSWLAEDDAQLQRRTRRRLPDRIDARSVGFR
jgi:hypothetical protein